MSSPSSPVPGTPASPSLVVSSPADILSYIPHALGFLPSESLVVLTTAGRKLGATLRVDLPDAGADPLGFAHGVLSFLEGDLDADGTLVVVYTEEPWGLGAPAPRSGTVLTLEDVLDTAGLPVRGGWLVSRSAWRDFFCLEEECCPWPGHPLDTVAHSALNAELIFGGSAFDASAPDAVLRAAPSVAERATARTAAPDAVIRAVETAQAHYAACCAGRWTTPDQFRATSALWDAVLHRFGEFDAEAEPDVAGFLLASVEARAVRDFLLVSACLGSAAAVDGAAGCGLLTPGPRADTPSTPDGGPAAAGVLPEVRRCGPLHDAVAAVRAAGVAAEVDAGLDPESEFEAGPDADPGPGGRPEAGSDARYPEPRTAGPASCGAGALRYADVLAGRYPGAIAWDRVDAMSILLARLAAVSDGESCAAALTMSAWFEYARGRGSRAAVFLDAAERAVPGYRLARLLHELLRRGGLPVWARSRTTAWTEGAAAALRVAA
ncbi:hypothetical protein C4K88_05990 [Arthrobacter pityocampae]|uniref:DUF4192 domain-containing protein n=1 Tax=Arthrobacter pityocampae TaxID=547334 RepID=A0A2S5J082_9MICC|nr:DUF4192 domain-containing protein [Arthrobacter pityocampae]PPB50207.1 hypothetical protein C4K88_05990 [Arthrobacter pityocampae]